MNALFVIGIFLAFFMQFLLMSKKQKSLSDKILAAWMFIIGVHLFSYYIYSLGYWERYPHLIGITHPLPLLHGPTLFLYVLFSLRKDQQFHRYDLLHFLPAALAYLYMSRFYFFYPVERKVLVNHGQVDDFSVFMNISVVAFIISGIVYPVLAYRLIGKYQKIIRQNFSFEDKIDLVWLKYWIGGIGIVYVTAGLISTLREGMGIDFNFNADLIFYSEIVLFVFFIGYFGIRHQGIFVDKVIEIAEPEPKSSGEYKKSGLKPDDAEIYHKRLVDLMNNKKPYLDSKLTLNMLAGILGISVNHLSQIINQYQEKNFYDFVNEYRVNEFKERVSIPKNRNLSILAIALDSGFNSKSSFNQVFKKHTGKTPSQYIQEDLAN